MSEYQADYAIDINDELDIHYCDDTYAADLDLDIFRDALSDLLDEQADLHRELFYQRLDLNRRTAERDSAARRSDTLVLTRAALKAEIMSLRQRSAGLTDALAEALVKRDELGGLLLAAESKLARARQDIADLQAMVRYPLPAIDPDTLRDVATLARDGYKIAAIKRVREAVALIGGERPTWGLKDTKEFVETLAALLPVVSPQAPAVAGGSCAPAWPMEDTGDERPKD